MPITVTAVADPVTHSGQSVLVEDTAKTIGSDIVYGRIDVDGTEFVTEVTVSGFAVGSVVNYDDVAGNSADAQRHGDNRHHHVLGPENRRRRDRDPHRARHPQRAGAA